MSVIVCVKWTELRPEIDQLHGTVEAAPHGAGLSESDLAAVETALRLAESWNVDTTVLTVGPAEAEDTLRELLAAGADRAVRVDSSTDLPSVSVARTLAAAIQRIAADEPQASVVVCGDVSADRGSGAVPAFLAAELDAAQALGLIGVTPSAAHSVEAVRRLDGGRRERLSVGAPAVLSVEGSVAELRRAPLAATLRAKDAAIEVFDVPVGASGESVLLRPWRPRARVLAPPSGARALDRIVQLTGAFVDRTPPRTVVLDPPEAAAAILDQLRDWGYLDPTDSPTTGSDSPDAPAVAGVESSGAAAPKPTSAATVPSAPSTTPPTG